jgi:hypothetical protein
MYRSNRFVIPAQAGIQCGAAWTPAFAGVTGEPLSCYTHSIASRPEAVLEIGMW